MQSVCSMPLSGPFLRAMVIEDLWLCVLVVAGVAGHMHAQWHGEMAAVFATAWQ